MDNFTAVYKILASLEAQMDLEKANPEAFSAEALGVSRERWKKYLRMMAEADYISGVRYESFVDGGGVLRIDDIRLTLKGLEYLQDNSMMRKVYRSLKGIKDAIPGL